MKYALSLGENGRVLSATAAKFGPKNAVTVAELPGGDLADYRYADGEFCYDPLPEPEQLPTHLDKMEAQLVYTAMMTDTLLEV